MLEIQPTRVSLHQLIQDRLFRIPDYQRSYSWGDKQRKELFEDIRLAHSKGPERNHFMATVVGLRSKDALTIGSTEYSVVQIVDGQQRLTTLIILLKAIALSSSTNKGNWKIRDEIEGTLVKEDKATSLLLQTNHDTSDYFKTYINRGTHVKSSEARTAADHEILSAIEDCERFVQEWVSDKPLLDLFSLLKNRLFFVFHEIADEALVYSVFEVLNSRGLPVPWFDRLKSMLMAVVFESDSANKQEFINQVHLGWADLYRTVGLNLGMRNRSMRYAATLWNPTILNRILAAEPAAFRLLDLSDREPQGVLNVTDWLKQVTRVVDDLESNLRLTGVTRIGQANLVAVAIKLRTDFSDSERAAALKKWEDVAFLIYGICRADARYSVGYNVNLAWDITNSDLSVNEICERLSEIGDDYSMGDEKYPSNSNWYRSWGEQLIYFFRRYEEHLARKNGQRFDNEQWNKIWAASAAASIEHIRPQSEGGKHIHRLGNLMLLPPGVNSQLQNKPVRDKVETYRKTGLLMAQEVADLVDCHKIRSHWTIEAIQAREEALWEWARQEWGG